MSTFSDNSKAYQIAGELIDEQIINIRAAGSGANSNVYQIETEQRLLALKLFPVRKGDSRKRVKNEWDALKFMRQNGISSVPEPIAQSEKLNAMVFSWLDGSIVTKHTDEDLVTALEFISEIFRISLTQEAQTFGLASEACLSEAEITRQILARIDALYPVPGLNEFVEANLLPTFEKYCEDNKIDLSDSGTLNKNLMRLIPADFGFHNTLKSSSGTLSFVDFDYFGWDDPVKMTADFILHPAHNLSQENVRTVQRLLAKALPEDADFNNRLKRHLPLYALRWAIILLNPFRRDRIIEDKIGTPEFLGLLERQISKATNYCTYVKDYCE